MQAYQSALLIVMSMVVLYVATTWKPVYNEAKAAYEKCEAELPRNQQCKLIAVPEDKEGE